MSIKQDLICSDCSKILDKPVILPCSDTICHAHLFEPNVVKQNSYKCLSCGEEFSISESVSYIRPNKCMQKLIDNERHLSEEERELKQSIERSLDLLGQLCDEFCQIKLKLDVACHERMADVRRKIDLHREELKSRIDEIALEMIEQTKKFETENANNLKKKFDATHTAAETCSKSSNAQSLDEARQALREKFREPSVSLDSIRKVKLEHDECIDNLRVNF
jgi:DNA-directed RNA polymerase subunit RPC12/RpoP